MASRTTLLTAILLPFLGGPAPAAQAPPKVAVFSIELNNLHKTTPDSAFPGRIRALHDALTARLHAACGFEVVAIDSASETAARLTAEYYYDHPDVAAGVGAAAGADWVVIPRLNRASAWAADLQAHVVRVRDTALVSNRIVELKGLELGPELAARLTDRGAAWMADQLAQAVEWSLNPGRTPVRRCPPNAP